MSLTNLITTHLPDLSEEDTSLHGVDPCIIKDSAEIRSSVFSGGKFRRARVCNLSVPGKFTAETLVIYPDFGYDFPIFGTEYLRIGSKKYFGATDFHPISSNMDYAELYLKDFPNSEALGSKFYDLSKFFSSKFSLKKSEEDFYEEYLKEVSKFLGAYHTCSEEALPSPTDSESSQREYDVHMAENDPARGILKAYFSPDFAETYIHNFLFTLANGQK